MVKETKYIAFKTSMLITATLMTVGQLVFIWLFKYKTGTDFVVALYQGLYDNFMSVGVQEMDARTFELYQEAVDIILTSFMNLTPAIIIIFSMVLAYGSYLVSKLIAKITKRSPEMYLKFSDIRAPKFIAKGFVVFFLLSVFIDESVLGHCILNIVSIFSFVLTICGITFILRKMAEKKLPGILRILVGIGILFSFCIPLVSYFYIGTGLFDAFKDIRSEHSDNGGSDNE